jgi:hypothetical protein
VTLSDPVPATISRRSGRHSKLHHVLLGRLPEDYKIGDAFTITIGEHEIPVCVEVPISDHNSILRVA